MVAVVERFAWTPIGCSSSFPTTSRCCWWCFWCSGSCEPSSATSASGSNSRSSSSSSSCTDPSSRCWISLPARGRSERRAGVVSRRESSAVGSHQPTELECSRGSSIRDDSERRATSASQTMAPSTRRLESVGPRGVQRSGARYRGDLV